MEHNYDEVFETENPLWQDLLKIFNDNEKYPKKRVKFRELHHKFPRSFSKKLGEEVDNSDENLISLTPGQHFIVHWIYWKLARTGYKASMAYAFNLMYKKSMSKVTYETALEMAKDIDQIKRDMSEYKLIVE